MEGVRTIFRLSGRDWIDFAEAITLCISIKLMVLLLPLKRYRKLLGKQNEAYTGNLLPTQIQVVNKVARALVRSRRIIPWKSQCLVEAIVAKLMLSRRKVSSTLFLGVNKTNHQLLAHAWLRCGYLFVTGKRGSSQFIVVSTFT